MTRAFSLVELSIVLVILGLLLGGVLTGQSLIHAAELRKTVADIDKFKTIYSAFRDKYFGIPGDLNNAESFWGKDASDLTCSWHTGVSVGTPGTCNGDGNNQIDTISTNEQYRAWQHLQLAGLLEGKQTGGGAPIVIGVNVPATPLGGGTGYLVAYGMYLYSKGGPMRPQHTLIIDTINATATTLQGYGVKSLDAWNIDQKIDDGRPGFGNVRIYWPLCAINDTTYDTTSSNVMCSMIIGMRM